MGVDRAYSLHEILEAVDRRKVHRAIAKAALKETQIFGSAELSGNGDEGCALALAEVISGGFSGVARIAENAKDVVTELEGLTERRADSAERRYQFVVSSGEARPQHERMFHGVACGLMPDNA